MIIEAHVIQNVSPANLNRDDTGAPKEATFGGYRRARVSSQAWKRAVRQSFESQFKFKESELAWRTRRLVDRVAEKLIGSGWDAEEAHRAVGVLLSTGQKDKDESQNASQDGDETSQESQQPPAKQRGRSRRGSKKSGQEFQQKVLWFVARSGIDTLADLCKRHRDVLIAGKRPENAKEIWNEIEEEVIRAKAIDIALFGRMLTNAPTNGEVKAAVQVAHAISTHRVDSEFDYFTAVDDLQPREEVGAGMIGTVEFNSACLYRYAALDTEQLIKNLEGATGDPEKDAELAHRAALAFIVGFITVMPTGKQNTFAAHNPPAAAFLVVRERGSWNLANAFVDPVRATSDADLIATSCERLASHWQELVEMYDNPAQALGLACLPSLRERFGPLGQEAQDGQVEEVAEALVNAAFKGQH